MGNKAFLHYYYFKPTWRIPEEGPTSKPEKKNENVVEVMREKLRLMRRKKG